MNFADKLKELRIAHRLTQEMLADAVGVKRATITQYEKGRIAPSHDVLLRIATFFHVSLDDLVDLFNQNANQDDKCAWLPIAVETHSHEQSLYKLVAQRIVADLYRTTQDDFVHRNRLALIKIIETVITLNVLENKDSGIPLSLIYSEGTVDLNKMIKSYLVELGKLKKLTDLME